MDFEKINKTKFDLEMIAFAVSLLLSDVHRENLVLQKLYEIWTNETDSVGKASYNILKVITPNPLQTLEKFSNYCTSSNASKQDMLFKIKTIQRGFNLLLGQLRKAAAV